MLAAAFSGILVHAGHCYQILVFTVPHFRDPGGSAAPLSASWWFQPPPSGILVFSRPNFAAVVAQKLGRAAQELLLGQLVLCLLERALLEKFSATRARTVQYITARTMHVKPVKASLSKRQI